jgi:hypothetical protein
LGQDREDGGGDRNRKRVGPIFDDFRRRFGGQGRRELGPGYGELLRRLRDGRELRLVVGRTSRRKTLRHRLPEALSLQGPNQPPGANIMKLFTAINYEHL